MKVVIHDRADHARMSREGSAARPGARGGDAGGGCQRRRRADERARARAVGSDGARQSVPGVKNVIAVGAGKGGVGKTTVAVNLAIALSSAAAVSASSTPTSGPNADHARHEDAAHDRRQEDRARGEIGLQVISMGFLTGDDAPDRRVRCCTSALQQFFRVAWANLDYLVIDLPPGTGDVALSLSQTSAGRGRDRRDHAAAGTLADTARARYAEAEHPAARHHREHGLLRRGHCRHSQTSSGHGEGEQMAADFGYPSGGFVCSHHEGRCRCAVDDWRAGLPSEKRSWRRRAVRRPGLDCELQPGRPSS